MTRTGPISSASGSPPTPRGGSSSGRSGSFAPAGHPARCAAIPSTRPATSARARTAPTSTEPPPSGVTVSESGSAVPGMGSEATLAALRDGELEVVGRLIGSSNNAMVVRVRPPGSGPVASELLAVWKPTRGEQPLFDFPVGTLTRREVAAFLVSEATPWAIVPPTLLRQGPYGEGMLQRWIDVDASVDIVQLVLDADPRLRTIGVFDAIVHNTDPKGG